LVRTQERMVQSEANRFTSFEQAERP